MRILLYASGVLLVATAALAETAYRWLDEQGNLSFSDRPPPAGSAEPVTIAPLSAAASALRSSEKRLLSDIEQRERADVQRKEKTQLKRLSSVDEQKRRCRDVDRQLDARPSREERSELLSQRRELRCGVR